MNPREEIQMLETILTHGGMFAGGSMRLQSRRKPARKPPARFAMHGHKMRYHFDPSPSLANREHRLKQIPPAMIAKIKTELKAHRN